MPRAVVFLGLLCFDELFLDCDSFVYVFVSDDWHLVINSQLTATLSDLIYGSTNQTVTTFRELDDVPKRRKGRS